MGAMAFCSDHDPEHRAHGALLLNSTAVLRQKWTPVFAGMDNEDLFRHSRGRAALCCSSEASWATTCGRATSRTDPRVILQPSLRSRRRR